MKRSGVAAQKKNVIFYARDYRHFPVKSRGAILYLLLCVLPTVLVFTLLYSPITHRVCLWAGRIVSEVTGNTVAIESTSFLPGLGGVHYIAMDGSAPSYTHALIAGILTLAAIPLASQAKRNSRPLMIYFCMGLYVLLASSIFFLFWPERFPYDLSDYSELYMLQTTALWILLPMLFGIALSLLRSNFIMRIVAILFQVGIMCLFDIVRYAVYLCVLYYCTSLYMATLYFTFGVLFDFIQMVTIYAFYSKKVSEQYASAEGSKQWAWS